MITLRVGSLHQAEVEAILRPVSSSFAAVTGAGRDVEARVGEEVLERLRRLGELPVGGAVITPGGELTVPFLIHVVVQSAEEPVSADGIRRALLNGLRRASEWEMERVGMPPLGTGAGNLAPEASARITLPVLWKHMEEHAHPVEVQIVVPNAYEEEVFRSALDRAPASAREGLE